MRISDWSSDVCSSDLNLLLFNPLCLLLLPGGWRIVRGRAPGPWFGRWLGVVAACTIVALFMLWLPTLPQRNAQRIALLLPVPPCLWLALGRQGLRTWAVTTSPPRSTERRVGNECVRLWR